jgi:hypothetical protein
MLLTEEQIQKSIAWLLHNGSPPIRYLTHRRILGERSDTEMTRELWRTVETCPDVAEILDKQNEDGSWFAGGSWAHKAKPLLSGYNPETPKYVTTIWILPHLGDVGFSVQDERVRRACEYVLTFDDGKNPDYRILNEADYYPDYSSFGPCRFSQYLIAFAKVGLDDPRVTKGYQILLNSQREDGGWVAGDCVREKGWTRSCPASSYGCTYALYCRKERHTEPLIRALGFLIWHLSTKTDADLRRFWYHGHSTVHALLMFSEFGIGLDDRPVGTIVEWLMSMYDPQKGCFHYTGVPPSRCTARQDSVSSRVAKYRFYHLSEDDWLTYYATRIALNVQSHAAALEQP